MSEYYPYNPGEDQNFDETEGMRKLIEIFGSKDAAILKLEVEIPKMEKELDELQDQEHGNLNETDLARIEYLEGMLPKLMPLLEILKQSNKKEKRIDKDSQIQDLGETIH